MTVEPDSGITISSRALALILAAITGTGSGFAGYALGQKTAALIQLEQIEQTMQRRSIQIDAIDTRTTQILQNQENIERRVNLLEKKQR